MMDEGSFSRDVIREDYHMGDFIFFEGDEDYHFYVVETGRIQIFTKNSSGQRIDIATVEPGESFGEFALLDNQPRSASAQALSHCTLVKVSQKGYEQLLAEIPVWASSMLKSFSRRMKATNQLLQNAPQFLSRED